MSKVEFAPLRAASTALVVLALLALAGCATLSPDGGMERVQNLARERLGKETTLPGKDADPAATHAATRELLRKPLTVEAAVEIASLNNSSLKLAPEVAQLAGETRRAFFSAVAMQESVKYFEQVKLAAEAAAELATQMAKIGNFNKLAQMREQMFYADATGRLAKAKHTAAVERERLTRLLGLGGADLEYRLPERLPDLPSTWVDTKLARAEATHAQTIHPLRIALAAQSEVRERYQTYRTTYDLARHYRDEVVPLRKRIADENVLRYNGMLIGVFELLADARDQIASVNAYIDALRDFWIAETDLQLALSGTSPEVRPRPGGRTARTNGAAASGSH